jgi:hypothetical protein
MDWECECECECKLPSLRGRESIGAELVEGFTVARLLSDL